MSEELKVHTPEWWNSQIQKGLKWRADTGFESRWSDIKDYYEHRFKNPLIPKFNLVYMLGSSLVPAIVFQAPSIVNSVRKPSHQYWGGFFDSIDNWLIDEMEVKGVIRKGVLNAFLYNTVGIQVGYDYDQEIGKQMEEMEFKPLPNSIDRSRKTNQPWIDLIKPESLVLCPGTEDMRNCRWFGKFLAFPTRLVKELEGFEKSKVVVTHIPTEVQSKTVNNWMSDAIADEGYTCFYEMHDAEKKEWFCIDTDGHIIKPPEYDELQVDGLPLEVLSFNQGSHGFWGVPDSLLIESQMLEGNECRKIGRLQRRLAVLKFLYDISAIKEEDIDKFLSEEPGMALGVDIPEGKSITELIFPIQAHIQGELFQVQKEQLNDAQLLTGTGPNQFGTFASGRRTKYETQVVEERNLLRSGARREMVGDIISSLMEKINQLVIKNWTAPVIQKVVGVEGAAHWVRDTPAEFAELTSQLVTKVNIESLAPVSRERRKQEMIEVLGVLAKFQGINPMPIIQAFISNFPWADVMQVLPQSPEKTTDVAGFQQQQQQALQQGNLGPQLQSNLAGMNSVVNSMPNMTMGGE